MAGIALLTKQLIINPSDYLTKINNSPVTSDAIKPEPFTATEVLPDPQTVSALTPSNYKYDKIEEQNDEDVMVTMV